MKTRIVMGLAASLMLVTSAYADDDRDDNRARMYDVKITNVTPGISFTPLLVTTHSAKISMFTLGKPASPGLAFMAEAGNPSMLAGELAATGEVLDSVATSGLLAPGASVTVRVRVDGQHRQLSVGGMLLPTNDGFVGLNGVDLPANLRQGAWHAIGYDAGSEPNDELCANIPGPHCGGVGPSPNAGGEDFVHVHSGIHGFADLKPSEYDWRNPTALVEVRRVQ
jgi:Spondin_N